MAKLTLNNILTGYASNTAVNANNDLVEAAIENTLSRDGSTPNAMGADLDMNSNQLTNLGAPSTGTDGARLQDITDAASLTSSNASLTTYTPSGTGSVATTVKAKLDERPSPADKGATGDFVADDTTEFQALLDNHSTIYLDGSKTYGISETLTLNTGNKIFMNGATIKILDSASAASLHIFSGSGATDIGVYGPGTLDGNKAVSSHTKGHGIILRDTSNVFIGGGLVIKNIKDDAGGDGDGILITRTSSNSDNITIDGVHGIDVERNIVAIESGTDVNISNISGSGTGLHCVDIEAGASCTIDRVNISNVDATALGSGSAIAVFMNATATLIDNINIDGLNVDTTSLYGVQINGRSGKNIGRVNISNFNIANGGDSAAELGFYATYVDELNISNFNIEKSYESGMYCRYIGNLKVRQGNSNNNGTGANAYGFYFRDCTTVDIDGLYAFDGADGAQLYGLYLDTITEFICGSNTNFDGTTAPIFHTGVTNWNIPTHNTYLGTIAAGTDDERPIGIAEGVNGSFVIEAYLINAVDITQNDTNYSTYDVGRRSASGLVLTSLLSSLPTTQVTGGTDFQGFVTTALGVDQNQGGFTSNLVLTFKKTDTAAGAALDEAMVTTRYINF